MISHQLINFSKSLQNDYLEFCNARGIKLSNLLLGTLQILLHRYSDQKVIFIESLGNKTSSNNKSQNLEFIQWIKGGAFSSISFENSIRHNSVSILNSGINLSEPLETLLESLQPKTETSSSAY